VLQKKMNEIYTGKTKAATLPPIQIQPPSMGSVLDMLNIINGILFVQISQQDIENFKAEFEKRQQTGASTAGATTTTSSQEKPAAITSTAAAESSSTSSSSPSSSPVSSDKVESSEAAPPASNQQIIDHFFFRVRNNQNMTLHQLLLL